MRAFIITILVIYLFAALVNIALLTTGYKPAPATPRSDAMLKFSVAWSLGIATWAVYLLAVA